MKKQAFKNVLKCLLKPDSPLYSRMPAGKLFQMTLTVILIYVTFQYKCIPVTHDKSTALSVRTSGIVLQKHQPCLVSTEDRVADRTIGRTKCCAGEVLQVDVIQSAASL